MTRLGDLYRQPDREPPLMLGRVKAAPDTIDDEVHVIVETFDQRFTWGPCPWTPRGEQLPAAGDRALVARVEGETWVVAWWPS